MFSFRPNNKRWPCLGASVHGCTDFSAFVLILGKKISKDADLRADSKILLILLLLFGKNTKNSVVRYNTIKICLLKNKLIPNEKNTDSRKFIHHNVTTDHNATTQNRKKNCLPEDVYKT